MREGLGGTGVCGEGEAGGGEVVHDGDGGHLIFPVLPVLPD